MRKKIKELLKKMEDKKKTYKEANRILKKINWRK